MDTPQPIVVFESSDYAETDLDQPTNYSLKYQDSEPTRDTELTVQKNIAETPNFVETLDLVDRPTNYSLKYRESGGVVEEVKGGEVVVVSSHYAETDLDQPTDYSLRYAEDDSEKPQTYCTEGTPYNFSTATSLSDLRTPDANKVCPQLKQIFL